MNFLIILIGVVMAAIDAIVLPMVNTLHITGASNLYMIIPVAIYSLQLFIFKGALQHGSMAQMNMIWDISSDIVVTLIGVLAFKEIFTGKMSIGLLLGLVSVYLLSGGAARSPKPP